jgi:hypothetical protein
MASVTADETTQPEARSRPRVGWGDDLAAALLATWVVAGLFLDGWAHVNRSSLETFFTPWHGVFYSGFMVATVVMARTVARHQQGGRFDPGLVPAGYGLALVGIGLFVVGAVADATWHIVFGVEVGVAALLSPSHLLLLAGGLLMVTGPIRSAWSAPDRPASSSLVALLPVLWATALTTAVVLFFFQYLSAFVTRTPTVPDLQAGEVALRGPADPATVRLLMTSVGVASVLITNLILLTPVLLLARRWRLPFGSVTMIVTSSVLGITALREFTLGALVPAMLVGALATDLLFARLRPAPDRPGAFRAVATVAPLLLWGAWLAAYAAAYGVAWPPELWAGVVLMAMLSGLGLSVLILPPAVPPGTWDPRRTEP